MKKIWFKRKLFGWGWRPSSWEGWLVLLVWIVFLCFFIRNIEQKPLKNFIILFASMLILVFICYKRGEKPRWQWGKRIED